MRASGVVDGAGVGTVVVDLTSLGVGLAVAAVIVVSILVRSLKGIVMVVIVVGLLAVSFSQD